MLHGAARWYSSTRATAPSASPCARTSAESNISLATKVRAARRPLGAVDRQGKRLAKATTEAMCMQCDETVRTEQDARKHTLLNAQCSIQVHRGSTRYTRAGGKTHDEWLAIDRTHAQTAAPHTPRPTQATCAAHHAAPRPGAGQAHG
jgi:hypothetical protein